MKKEDVKIGDAYVVKVSGRLVEVTIMSESQFGGWNGMSLATGRHVRIRTAARLRKPADQGGN